MKKVVITYEYYCDCCSKMVDRLFGSNFGGILVELNNIEQCDIIPKYSLSQNGGRTIRSRESGICNQCFKHILQKALDNL